MESHFIDKATHNFETTQKELELSPMDSGCVLLHLVHVLLGGSVVCLLTFRLLCVAGFVCGPVVDDALDDCGCRHLAGTLQSPAGDPHVKPIMIPT